ncbi:site-specific DNA-methyltransferase [Inquilinus sp. YAF38]|uniref:DNA-methyltransferase n=1 Tax=Inquilinus sp. YAF38 TaxID=3233084 RepID=UPI003F93F1CE
MGDALDCLERLSPASVDLIVTSPPYFVGKEYDASQSVKDFVAEIRRVLPAMMRCLKPGGSLCWQVGNHVQNGRLTPLDAVIVAELQSDNIFLLRNRIVWTFGHGVHEGKRFSGRHETVLWYTKGAEYHFDLDASRVPQLYPGKRHYKGPKKGSWSGNPLGKNPGDVWDIGDVWGIPNVKASHIEKTEHPCQFPTALVRRLVVALSPKGGLVVDPYLGSGTSAVSALLEGRNAVGCDLERKYLQIAESRIQSLIQGNLPVREDIPVRMPDPDESVAKLPPHFRPMMETVDG